MSSALVIGATGLVGGLCIEALLASNEYETVRVLTRRALPIENDRIDARVVSFDRLEDYKELFAVDAVFCCLGTTMKKAKSKEAFKMVDMEYPVQAAEISAEMGVKQFLMVSAMGADAKSAFFYNQVKGETENRIRQLDLETIAFFRPSLILGQRGEKRFGEDLAKWFFKFLNPLLVGPLKKFGAIEASSIAGSMVRFSTQGKKGIHIIESHQMRLKSA